MLDKNNIDVVMKVSDIPDKAIVTKLGGTFPHVLRHKIPFFCKKEQIKPIEKEGYKFLISESGDVSVVPNNKKVIYHTSLQMLTIILGI